MAVRGSRYGRSRYGESPAGRGRDGYGAGQQVMQLARQLADNIIRQREFANRTSSNCCSKRNKC